MMNFNRRFKMGIFSWIGGNNEDDIIVTTGRSKGKGKHLTNITVGDIRRRRAVDKNGFENKVVIFLTKTKRSN